MTWFGPHISNRKCTQHKWLTSRFCRLQRHLVGSGCSMEHVDFYTVVSADVTMTILICCYCALAFLCIRIYVEIRQLQVRVCVCACVGDRYACRDVTMKK